MPNIGPLEIAIVLMIALVVFGPKRLPELGHSVGKGFREFKSSITGADEDQRQPATRRIEGASEESTEEVEREARVGSAS